MNKRAMAAAILIAATSLPAAASAQGYGYPGGGYNNGNGERGMRRMGARTGIISSVQGSSLTLQDGRTVFLRPGTVINPTGTRLQPGMRIAIVGSRDGRGRINASEIDVNQRGHRNRGNGYNNGYGR